MNPLFRDFGMASDPVAFAQATGFAPYDYQMEVLRSPAEQIALNWCRQAGKSTATSYLPVHQATYHPKSLTLVLGPGERQAILLLDKIYEVIDRMGKLALRLEKENTQYLKMENGSEIHALPGKGDTIRGFSDVDLIVIDEASRVSDSFYHAVRPMRAKGTLKKRRGRIVLLSTPAGKRGFFHRACTSASGRWAYFEVPHHRVPHITEEFIADERAELPSQIFEQEYECAFLDEIGAVFTLEQIQRALSDATIEPLFGLPALTGPLSDRGVTPLAF